MIALFVGRFQPLHKGHEKVIRNLLKKYEKVIVAIGSINQKRSFKNPFTFIERKKMFEILFKNEIKKGKIEIIGIKDYFNDEKWSNALIKRKHFDVVVTGNKWTERCFKRKKKIEKVKIWKREIYEGRKIRKMMIEGNLKWKEAVPKEIVNYLEKIVFKQFFKLLKQKR
ncbi:MAG: hypothetical protein B6U78_01615 [Candidatus Aenigmarchaeota archaeon ex4484_224]|nr:MAG: hypothetical protein B6U78_01615 [Candidatus Aenigmarchaeota archaeon ex4484_224]